MSFDNPDFVDLVLHSCRYRTGTVPDDPDLDALEQRLAAEPRITVPTIVLQGADDGVDRPEQAEMGKRRTSASCGALPL